MPKNEFWSEVLNLKYKKHIVRGKFLGIIFEDNVYYNLDEMKHLSGVNNDIKMEAHKMKKIFSGCIEALDNILTSKQEDS